MSSVFPDPRLDLEARLRRCFPHRDVRVFARTHDATQVVFFQGHTRHEIDVPTPQTARPNEMRALMVHVGAQMLDVLFPKGRHTA